jgi:diguanylate cyclase (GGDEF)-like protein/putative nucleotidyltransferase with HDIG domain
MVIVESDSQRGDVAMDGIAETINLSGIRILVVDDDEAIRLLSERVLMSYGGVVEAAENGRVALQILLRQDFDVVLVDLRMQEMDGITFIQEARNIWPWLGFIIMTGYMDDVSEDLSERLNIRRILEKPVRPLQLAQGVLAEHLERRAEMGSAGSGLEQHQRQLRMLGHLGETALASGTFVEALQEMSEGLGALMSCDVAGMFGFSEGETILVLNAQSCVSDAFIRASSEEIVARYEALSGKTIDRGNLRLQVQGVPQAPDGPSVPGRLLTIPLLVHNEVQGVLLLAATGAEKLAAVDLAFVYHIANVLSSILSAVTRIRQMAAHDSLTKLYNRAYFEEQTEQAWQLARRYNHNMAVAITDIDHFKSINDTHGHLVGDRILREFAGILTQVARTSDVVARYGGDEFVVLLPHTDLPSGLTLGNRIRKAVDEHLFCADSLCLKLTASVGLATSRDITPSDHASEMLRLADVALYTAKREGRNRCCLWTPSKEREAGVDVSESRIQGGQKEGATHTPFLLVVDDDEMILKVLKRILEGAGYRVETAGGSQEAIEKVRQHPGQYDAAITDLTMPGLSGLDLLAALRQTDSFVMTVVMTGYATKENAVACLREGAFDFIEKPVTPVQLLAVMEKVLEHRRLRIENERYRLHLEDMIRQKSAVLMETMEALKSSYDFTLQSMVGLLDVRERNTGQHSNRVRTLAHTLGKIMSLSRVDLDALSRGAQLHDIGKIAVPDSILLKAGPLTEDEWKVMKTHPEVGYNILSASPYLKDVAEVVRSHQERYDGKGYPRGLKGDDICLGARIFCVIDSYDAMRSDRPYRKSMPREEAIEEIRRCSGSHFDPAVVDAFLRHVDQMEATGCWS